MSQSNNYLVSSCLTSSNTGSILQQTSVPFTEPSSHKQNLTLIAQALHQVKEENINLLTEMGKKQTTGNQQKKQLRKQDNEDDEGLEEEDDATMNDEDDESQPSTPKKIKND